MVEWHCSKYLTSHNLDLCVEACFVDLSPALWYYQRMLRRFIARELTTRGSFPIWKGMLVEDTEGRVPLGPSGFRLSGRLKVGCRCEVTECSRSGE